MNYIEEVLEDQSIFEQDTNVFITTHEEQEKYTNDTAVCCYINEIPSHIEAELECLYGTIFSSLKKLSSNGGTHNASTYIALKHGKIVTIFLFRRTGRIVQVLNQVMSLSGNDVKSFASYIFKMFSEVDAITFTAVHLNIDDSGLPIQQISRSENIVVSLPATEKEYWARLGKSTRHNLNYYRNKLNRDFPPFSFTVYVNEAITPLQISKVIALSKARMTEKGKTFGLNQSDTADLTALANVAGMLALIEIDGEICAGSICYRAGDNYSLEVIAHDPAFNEYRLGTLCCYLTISECIARGAKEFHFLWGQYDYKYRFLGQQRKLDNIAIYRSPWHRMRCWKLTLGMAIYGVVGAAKRWKNNPSRKRHFIEIKLLLALSWMKSALDK